MKLNATLKILMTMLIAVTSCSVNTSNISSDNSQAEKLTVENADPENAEILSAQKLIEKIPDSADGYNRLATAYIRKARSSGDFSLYQKAETAVNRALEIDPQDLTAKKLKGVLHLAFHRFAEARELALQLLKEAPNDSIIYGILTDANIELGNYEEAVESAQKMVDLRPSMEAYIRVALLRSLHGQVEGAIEAMKTAASIADPKDREAKAWCFVRLGDEYFKIGKFKEAEKHYDTALEIYPDYYFALAAKGRVRAAQGDFNEAVNFYSRSQNYVPMLETIISLGDIYLIQGNAEKAKAQYDLAEVIEEKLGKTDMRRLALLWADHDKRLDEALTIAEQEYNKRKDIYTADIYAWTLYKKGQFELAKQVITQAMRLKTKDARIFYHAGMIEKALGNKREAIKYLKLALETNPAFDLLQADVAKKALEELKAV